MATVDKNFKVKNGLVVEGTTATVNGEDILTTASTTTDLTEGTNLYFTDQRAVDAVTSEIDSAVTTAVDALDTDVIEEGSTNLYFTNQRAIDAVGGSATSDNTPDTVVKRDANGNFAAGTVTVNRVNIGSVGYIEDDGSIEIVNNDGDDINLRADDIRLVAEDDVILTAGSLGDVGGDVVLTAIDGKIRLQGPDIYAVANDNTDVYTDSDRVATRGYVDDAIDGIDLTYTTDDVTEGTNLYFTNQRALDATSAAYDVAGAAAAAQTAAESYADGLAVNYDAAGAASAAQTAAESYADGLASNYDVAGAAAAAQTAAESYADDAVAGLVNGAPALLDTLNELAAALEDNPDVIADLRDIANGKQNTLTAGSNIDITADTISVTGLDAADISDFDTAALSATASAYDAAGAASAAQTAAESYADGLAVNYEAAGASQSAVDALDTDDIEEGSTNLYFTNQRALDATASAYDATGTAQGLVDGLTTDDIEEGTSLYFTNTRAVDALEAVVPNFTAVEVNSLAKQVATTVSSLGSVPVTAIYFLKTEYRTAKFLVKIDNGTDTEVTEVLLTLDSSDNIAITEYAIVGTNGTRGSITADVGFLGDVRIVVTPVNDSTIYVVGTLLV